MVNKTRAIVNWLVSIIKLVSFNCKLLKGNTLCKAAPESILKVIEIYIDTMFKKSRSEKLTMNRTLSQSALLLQALIKKWLSDGSDITLNQILEVLRNEFIKRG